MDGSQEILVKVINYSYCLIIWTDIYQKSDSDNTIW